MNSLDCAMCIMVNISMSNMIHSLGQVMMMLNGIMTRSMVNGGFVSPSFVADDRVMPHSVCGPH